jgi:DNA-binding response OmpR family regulator
MDHIAKRILVVDDDADICDVLQYNLENEGYSTEVAHSAKEAMKRSLHLFDLLLIDAIMGAMSGFNFAEKIRNELKLSVPIIFLSSEHNENDLLTGFNLDGDDYIFKPFSVNEILVRIKAVLNRYPDKHKKNNNIIRYGDVELDTSQKRLLINDECVELTKKEFEMLRVILQNPGKICTREDLLKKIWGKNSNVTARTIDVHISRIRNKLGEFRECLISKTGYGYYFEL